MIKYISVITVLIFAVQLNHAQIKLVKTYAAPPEAAPSVHFTVKVNGENSFVHQAPTAAYTIFDMNGPVDVVIKAGKDVKWVDVRPLQLHIKPEWKNDSTITLHLAKPCKISVELNGSIKMPLYIFANEFEKNVPKSTDPNVVFFAGGRTYNIEKLTLTSGQTLYLEGGAILKGYIDVSNAKNVKIKGRGILDGTDNGQERDQHNYFIRFQDSDNVELEGITLHNGTTWQVVPLHSNHVLIRNINIVSDNASDDGIDIVRSKNVTIENCFIRTKDDCIAIKAHLNYPPGEIVDEVMVRHCVFWNAIWGNALEIGFELQSSEVRNITFRDSDIIHEEEGAVLSIHNADNAIVHHILFEDIRIEDSYNKLFDVSIFLSQYSVDKPTDPAERKKRYLHGAWDGVMHVPADKLASHARYRGHVKDIVFRNIYVQGRFPYSLFHGFDKDHLVENIVIDNLVVNGRKIKSKSEARIFEAHTKGIEIK
jgi:hypothetical protein